MRIDILTLFPEVFDFFNHSILGKAQEKELLEINARNYARENFSVDGFGAKCLASYEKAIEEYEYESINTNILILITSPFFNIKSILSFQSNCACCPLVVSYRIVELFDI